MQVLENYHAARLFDIAGAPERDALRAFPGAQYGELRRMVIEFVLGTDVSRHRGLLEDTLRAVGPGEGRECACARASRLSDACSRRAAIV